MGAVLFNKKNKIPHPPVYEFPHTIKLLKYDGLDENELTKEVKVITNVKIEKGNKSTFENFEHSVLSGNYIFVDMVHSKGFDLLDFTLGTRIKFNDEVYTIKSVDETTISGELYAIEVFVA